MTSLTATVASASPPIWISARPVVAIFWRCLEYTLDMSSEQNAARPVWKTMSQVDARPKDDLP